MTEIPKEHVRFGNYKNLEITVDSDGQFFAWADDDFVKKPSLAEIREWIDKWVKLHFKRVPILKLSDTDYNVDQYAYKEAEICAIDADGDVWVMIDGRRSKASYGWERDYKLILNTPENRELANQRRELMKEAKKLEEKAQALERKMAKWKAPKKATR